MTDDETPKGGKEKDVAGFPVGKLSLNPPHSRSGLRQHKLIILRFSRLEVQRSLAGLKSRCWQSRAPSRGPNREPISLPPTSSRGRPRLLARGFFPHLQSQDQLTISFPHGSPLTFFSYLHLQLLMPFVITLDPPGYFGLLSLCYCQLISNLNSICDLNALLP